MEWQLRGLHHPESVVNCACMPDPGAASTHDTQTKETLKGELVMFLIRTGAGFATRQVRRKDPTRVTHLQVDGISNSAFNGRWVRCEFDVDGRPAFAHPNNAGKSGRFGQTKYFLYFRKWGPDDPLGYCPAG